MKELKDENKLLYDERSGDLILDGETLKCEYCGSKSLTVDFCDNGVWVYCLECEYLVAVTSPEAAGVAYEICDYCERVNCNGCSYFEETFAEFM